MLSKNSSKMDLQWEKNTTSNLWEKRELCMFHWGIATVLPWSTSQFEAQNANIKQFLTWKHTLIGLSNWDKIGIIYIAMSAANKLVRSSTIHWSISWSKKTRIMMKIDRWPSKSEREVKFNGLKTKNLRNHLRKNNLNPNLILHYFQKKIQSLISKLDSLSAKL